MPTAARRERKASVAESPSKPKSKVHLPDPKNATGPYRPFTSDPGRSEAWWWFWLPVLGAVLLFLAGFFAPRLYGDWIIPEGYGVLEFGQFIIMVAALVIAVGLLVACRGFMALTQLSRDVRRCGLGGRR